MSTERRPTGEWNLNRCDIEMCHLLQPEIHVNYSLVQMIAAFLKALISRY